MTLPVAVAVQSAGVDEVRKRVLASRARVCTLFPSHAAWKTRLSGKRTGMRARADG